HGDDNYYYLQAEKACTLSYVIKAATSAQQEARWSAVPSDHVAKRVIEEYKNVNNGYKPATLPGEILPLRENYPTMTDWLKAMFEHRGGSCEQRAAAVKWALQRDSNLEVYVTCIDNNHNYLEIKYEGKWILVDLGGAANYTETFAPTTQLYQQLARKHGTPTPKKTTFQNQSKVPIPLPEASSKRPKLKILVDRYLKPISLKQREQLDELLSVPHHHKVSLVSQEPRLLENYLLECAATAHRSVYVIDSAKVQALSQSALQMGEDAIISIEPDTPFAKFLKQAAALTTPRPQLIIHWDTFPPNEQVALNTLLDKTRSVKGYAITDNIQVISLYRELPKDSSLFSRAQSLAEINFALPDFHSQPSSAAETFIYDCLGFSDWEERLLGPIVLNNNQPQWNKSQWTERLLLAAQTNTPCTIRIQNLPEHAEKKVKDWIAQARAQGFFHYHGYQIPFPPHCYIEVDITHFNFAGFPKPRVALNATRTLVLSGAYLINDLLFDYVLHQKNIEDRKYTHKPGWLFQMEGKPIELWITYPLSISQWYCLFAQAKTENVALSLYLAPGVSLPTEITFEPFTATIIEQAEDNKLPSVIITTDANKYASSQNFSESWVIDVEDHNYGDLIGYVKYTQTPTHFENFEFLPSELLEKLRGTQSVILKGHFTDELLQALHPLLCGEPLLLANGSLFRMNAPLTLIVEVDQHELPNLPLSEGPLACLEAQQVSIINYDKTHTQSPVVLYSEHVDFTQTIDLTDHQQKTAAFMGTRLQGVLSALETHNIIQLVGPTGVGKSHLLQIIAKMYPVYVGLEKLDAWAADTSENAILFLDEFNTMDKHLT
ncbi:MAG: hypothetical protein ACHP9Y_05275, partial [Gammaproteobacteria bacterium]